MAIMKKQQPTAAVAMQAVETHDLVLPVKSIFKGDIVTEGNARIDGTVAGNITSQKGNILFGIESNVTGNIQAMDVATGGKIEGDITAKGQLSIFAGAKVQGNVSASSLVVENGAIFGGHVQIGLPNKQDAQYAGETTISSPKNEIVFPKSNEKEA